jgi:outer membrane lipoprotein carrier protein
MIIKKMIVGCLIWGVVMSVWSDTPSETLWNKLRAIESMQADFKQKIITKTRVLSESSGNMALVRPKHFRWHTKAPMAQLLVADGQQFWLYDVDLEQVTVRPQAGLEGAAAGLFLGNNKAGFEHDFKVTEAKQEKQVIFKLQATSKQANIRQMVLRFEGALLVGMDLFDQLGQQTAIVFKQVKNNETLPAKLFHFTPPKGVDLVKQ